ncbi:MAG: tol-pal system protein YbgF [Gammaproteobacteria bacterium]
MKSLTVLPLAGILVALALAGCATKPKPVPLTDPVYAKIDALEIRVAHLEHVLQGRSLFKLTAQAQRERGDIRKLSGALASLRHDLRHFRHAESARWIEVYRRLSRLQSASTDLQPAVMPAPSTSTQPPATATDTTAYQNALNLVEAGHYHAAIAAFSAFRQTYPQSPLVANADYWEGAAKLQLQDFSGALKDSLRVLKDQPQSPKAPAALFQAGLIQLAMGEVTAGKKTLTAVERQYPDSSSARLAHEKLMKLKAGGSSGHP